MEYIGTEREHFAELLEGRSSARILIESSTESACVARCQEGLGHEVVVADPNFAPMYATRSRRVKTDKRDARTLAEACKLGAYKSAHRTSDGRRHLRAQLTVREALVRTRARYISRMRALVRREGFRVGSGSAEAFPTRLELQLRAAGSNPAASKQNNLLPAASDLHRQAVHHLNSYAYLPACAHS
ncbi:IS110 family transposase [Hyalangium versicolor]|uniref:IS110 family transposase n=1 Tax=Hyalangium versicolor TaxID=2861190 RepID=UPI001CCDBEDC|nr:transposase [Hyalangium versicolor]